MSKRKYNILKRKSYIMRLRMSADMLNDISRYAKIYSMNKSEFVRFAINFLITATQNYTPENE